MNSPIQTFLTELHGELAGTTRGGLATYIPELTKADPEWFGICLVTMDGVAYSAGDVDQMGPGMEFGEMALLGQTSRSASVYADTEVRCRVLEASDFGKITDATPLLKITVLQNLASDMANRLRGANQWIAALA